MDAIVLKRVSKMYALGKTQVRALHEVDLAVKRGEMVCLAGPSGCGKTTLLNVIGALDPPTQGEVLIDDREVYRRDHRDLAKLRREKLGFIFQSFNLIPVLSAFENVEYPLILRRLPADERRRLAEKALADVDLLDRAHHKPDELSGGQRQRVAIARAMATNPPIVLADEPTANLDSRTGAAIIDLMSQVNRERAVTFIFSSHDAKIIDRATRVIHLLDGEIQG